MDQERHTCRAAKDTQKQDFLDLGDLGASWYFSGRSKVAHEGHSPVERGLQPTQTCQLHARCYVLGCENRKNGKLMFSMEITEMYGTERDFLPEEYLKLNIQKD